MRKELNDVKAAVVHLSTEIGDLKAMFRRTMLTVSELKGEVAEIKGVLKTDMATKSDISALNTRMDGFSGLLLDSRQRWAVHADVIQRHDDRLTKLENPS